MKAVTVHQPWATLLALGLKDNETRGWATAYRGDIAIHAGLKVDRQACEREPIKSVLAEHGYSADNLPTGAILAIGKLDCCRHVVAGGAGTGALLEDGALIVGNEFAFGDYSKGRYAWRISDRVVLERPIPAKGQQGLWNWNPEEVETGEAECLSSC